MRCTVCSGEEDMHAYDLSRLQKPIDGDTDSMIKPPIDNPVVQLDVPLTRECCFSSILVTESQISVQFTSVYVYENQCDTNFTSISKM